MKKYEFTGETKTLCGKTMKQIRALVKIDLGVGMTINPGYIGGWIEKEDNLSHEGNAWVFDNAWVFGNARIYDNALVFGDALVFGNAQVFNNARVFGDAWVHSEAQVCDDAQVYGNALVCGNARVFGDAWVFGDAHIISDAWVYDNARVFGDACVCGNACVCDDAVISKDCQWFTAGPMGSRHDTTTFFRNKEGTIKVKCGCFIGTIDEFLQKVEITHGNSKHAIAYRAAANLAIVQIGDSKVERMEHDPDQGNDISAKHFWLPDD